ncbi:hypothetical protein PMAYCL1PPCAC_11479, partial [Pristionchus mayeri]
MILAALIYLPFTYWCFSKKIDIRFPLAALVMLHMALLLLFWQGRDSGRYRKQSLGYLDEVAHMNGIDFSARDLTGIRTVTLTKENGKFGICRNGTIIYRVTKGGAGQRAGVVKGDQIMAINGVNVEMKSHEAIGKML